MTHQALIVGINLSSQFNKLCFSANDADAKARSLG